MGKGRDNKLVGATGEYLVAAELCRRGLIATTFTGNVPDYDIIASDKTGRHVSVQVKTIRSGSWQFSDVTKFFAVNFRGNRQKVGKPKSCLVRRLCVVFVVIGKNGEDRFYILPWTKLRSLLADAYKQYLAKHRGVRPQNSRSLHSGLTEDLLIRYRDNWKLIKQSLR